MDFLKQHREKTQIGAGLSIFFIASYYLTKHASISLYLFKSYKNMWNQDNNFSLRSLIKKPGKRMTTVLNNLTCVPSPDLFKTHMGYIDRDLIGNTKEFCFKESCQNFMAEIEEKEGKYEVYCDCSTFDPYVSSPLLVNNYDLIKKKGKKPRLSMITYGSIFYDDRNKRFNYEGHCFGTSYEQIQWVWDKIFKRNILWFFCQSIFLGLGISLLYHHNQYILNLINSLEQCQGSNAEPVIQKE